MNLTHWWIGFAFIALYTCTAASKVGVEFTAKVDALIHDRYCDNGTIAKASFLTFCEKLNIERGDIPSPCNDPSCQRQNVTENCLSCSEVFDIYSHDDTIPSSALSEVYPALIFTLLGDDCINSETDVKQHGNKPTTGQAWGYGIGFVSLVVFVANIGVFMGPCMNTRFFERLLMFCVALAVGTLASTGFLVLIPESMHLTTEDSPVPDYHLKMATVMGGAYFVFVVERMLNYTIKRNKKQESEKETMIEKGVNGEKFIDEKKTNNFHNHSHDMVTEKDGKKTIAPVAWILLIGDAMHNFVDGLSIGAAFTENTFIGISVSVAVLCEELPHELGDIAILLHSGLSMKKSLLYNFLAAVTIYAGLIIGIMVGENTNANQWIFGFAGGLFVYLALSDMIPEMNVQLKQAEESKSSSISRVFFYQNLGLLSGFGIIFILVTFGSSISV